jgi:hypothetical protein
VPAWPDVDADRALRAATLRLLTPRGGFAGTGFLIDLEGGCLHAITSSTAIRS